MPVQSIDGAFVPMHWQNYSKMVSTAIRSWNSNISWKPKDLRNALPTFAASEGILSDLWEQYLGHAPRTVTARHYLPRLGSASAGEKKELERQMLLFQRLVIEPLENAIQGKTVNLFSPLAKAANG